MAAYISPVQPSFDGQPSLRPPGSETGVPMDWEDVSVKDEPLDVPEEAPHQPAISSIQDDFEESKEDIRINSLGEVHYLPTEAGRLTASDSDQDTNGQPVGLGAVITDGVTVKVEQNAVDIDLLNITPIKEEFEDDPQQQGTGAAPPPDLSYLDDPRWYMSPRDQEIDPEEAPEEAPEEGPEEEEGEGTEAQESQPSSQNKVRHSPGKKSPKRKSILQQNETSLSQHKKGGAKKLQKKGSSKPSERFSGKVSSGRNAKVSDNLHEGVENVSEQMISDFLPCVVQICEMPQCGVDCRCTVNAPYPSKLKAVTISTEKNVMSLNMVKKKGTKSVKKVKESNSTTQKIVSTGKDLHSNSPNGGTLTSSRIGLGKRQAKMSDRLKLYIEERNRNKSSRKGDKIKTQKPSQVSFVCPICDKGFSYIFSFKQHIITHNVNDIINMRLPQKERQRNLQIDVEQPHDMLTEENVPPKSPNYETLRSLLSDKPSHTPLDKQCQKQVDALFSKDSPTTSDNTPVVLNVPQFKVASTAKKGKKNPEEETNYCLAEVVTYEKGSKVDESTFLLDGIPNAPNASTPGNSNPGGIIVIEPIAEFSPQNPNSGAGTSVARTVENSTEKTAKRLRTEKAKRALRVKLISKKKLSALKKSAEETKNSPAKIKIKTSPKAKSLLKSSPKEGDGDLSVLSVQALNKARLPRLSSGNESDSDATAPYGYDEGEEEEEDDRDEDYSPDEDDDDDFFPSVKARKTVTAKKNTGIHWLKQVSGGIRGKSTSNLQKKKKRESLRWNKKHGSEGEGTVEAPSKKHQERSAKGRADEEGIEQNADVLNTSDDMDSGIDLESDGSEQKKSPKKGRVKINENDKILQMLTGELVSRKELWVCVQSRLDSRKQREAVHCPMCDKAFNYPSALKRHVMMHTDEREFECPHCPKAFSRKPHLTEHIRVHTGERPFKCSHCPAAFAQRTNLMIHNRTHTGARPFKCPECGKRFRRQDAHTQHILTHHSKVKPYKCLECSAAFPCARYLKDHLRVHSKERPFKCDRCPAAFVCKKYLLLHVRALHLNERPFACKLCPAKFAQSGKLTEHNRVHTGERPYKCSSCGARFSRSGHLRRHLLTHTGVRPHACKFCDASFSQQDHLKRHVKNIHKDE